MNSNCAQRWEGQSRLGAGVNLRVGHIQLDGFAVPCSLGMGEPGAQSVSPVSPCSANQLWPGFAGGRGTGLV